MQRNREARALMSQTAWKLLASVIVICLAVPVSYSNTLHFNTSTSFFIGGGDGEDYLLYNAIVNYTAWNRLLDNMTRWHFNVMRLAFSWADSPGNSTTGKHAHTSIKNYTMMDNVVALLDLRGYKVVFDCHNWEDMNGWFGSQAWSDDWYALATHFKGDNRILAYELFNEPNNSTWSSNINSKADVARAYANLTDRIRSIDPSRQMVWAASSLYLPASLPPEAVRDNTVFAWHGWMRTINYANDLNSTVNHALERINEVYLWQQQYPNSKQWLGEFGAENVLNGVQFNATYQRAFDVTWINACVEHGWGFCFWLWSNEMQGSAALDYNTFLEASNYMGVPNIAVTDVVLEKTVVGQGFPIHINVTVENTGNSTESFNLTAYANTTSLGIQQVTLPDGNSTIIVFAWNTRGFALGNYIISAYAEPLLGETYVSDNNFTSISIHLGVPGDVSSTIPGVYDGTVNTTDIAYLISRFNTKPSSSNWDPNSDVNHDEVCNMRDIALAILNFNKHE